MTLHRLFIANRGEIACRIIQTAKRLGYTTIVPVSDVDKASRAARLADVVVPIGGDTPASSYLDQDKLLNAMEVSQADSLHPGYGFLAENADFARRVEAAGYSWVGPTPDVIEWMGDKREARIRVAKLGGPCVPGYDGEDQSDAKLREEAERIGLPLMLKAAHGGGGRGMRRVDDWADFDQSLESARREAKSAFGKDELILERAIDQARHVEVQVFGNGLGDAVHLYERDCSIQRRHQKVVEEAPCVALSESGRADLLATATEITSKLNYRSAGTLEFLLAPDGSFYFLEMNTRIQVEHPVSECITGLDLVEMQLRLAEGDTILPEQASIQMQGHAIELRVYAEDPATNYLPSSGPVKSMTLPIDQAIRLDQAIEAGDEISPFYDPMVAKVIAYGRNRDHALRILQSYLPKCTIFGFRHNLPFLEALLATPAVQENEVYTKWLDENPVVSEEDTLADLDWVKLATSIWATTGERSTSSGYDLKLLNLEFNDEDHWIEAERTPNGHTAFRVDGRDVEIGTETLQTLRFRSDQDRLEVALNFGMRELRNRTHLIASANEADTGDQVLAPLNGKVTAIEVEAGQAVAKGDTLVIIEAMKLETPVKASRDAVIESVLAEADNQVQQGERLISFVPQEGDPA